MMNKVSYNNLFKLLIDNGLKKKDFSKLCNLSALTMAKLSKNEYVSIDVLVRICTEFDCQISDIVQVINSKE